MSVHNKSQSSPQNFHIDEDSQGNQAIFIPIWQNEESVNNQSLLREKQQQIRMYKTKIQHLQKHLQDYDKNFQSLYIALNQATTSEKLIKKQLIQNRTIITHLKQSNQSLELHNKQLINKIKQLNLNELQLKTYKQQDKAQQKHRQSTQQQIQQLKKQLSRVELQNQALKKSNLTLQKQLKQLSTQLSNQIQENELLKEKLKKLQLQLNKQKKKSVNLQKRLLQTQSQLDQLNVERQMNSKFTQMEEQLIQEKQNNAQKDKHIKKLQREIQSLQQKFKKLSQASIQTKRAASHKKCQQCQELHSKVNQLQTQLNQMQSKLEDMEGEISQKKDELKGLSRQIQKLKRQNEKYRKQQQKSMKLIKKHQAQIQKLQQQIESLHQQIETMKQQLNKERQQKQGLQDQLQRLRSKNKQLTESNGSLTKQINTLNKDKVKDKLLKENQMLRQKIEQLQVGREGVEVNLQGKPAEDHEQCLKQLQVEREKFRVLQGEVSVLRRQLQKTKQSINIIPTTKPPLPSPQKQPISMQNSNYQQLYQQQLQNLRKQFLLKRYSGEYQRVLVQKQFNQRRLHQQQKLQQLKDMDVHQYYERQIRVILTQLEGLKLENAKLKEYVGKVELELNQQVGKNIKMQQENQLKLRQDMNISAESLLCHNCHLINDQLIQCQQQIASLNQQVYQLRCLNEQYLSTILTYQQTYKINSAKSATSINTNIMTQQKQLLSEIEFYKLQLRKLQTLFKQQQLQIQHLTTQIKQLESYYQAKIMNKEEEIKLLLVRMENIHLHKQTISYHTSTTNSPSRVLAKQTIMVEPLLPISGYNNYPQRRGRTYNKTISSKRQSMERRLL